MRKRLLSFLLIFTMIFSLIPVYAGAESEGVTEDGTAAHPYLIDNDKEFRDFLSNSNNDTKVYYRLNADITASDEAVIKGVTAKNTELDGQGHTVSGYIFEGAMFTKMTYSALRNVKFSNVTAIATADEAAIIALSTDKNTNITNCSFSSCTIDASTLQGGINAAFAVVVNSGIIRSCTVDNHCKVLLDTSKLTANKSLLGGIVAENKYYVIGSVSKLDFTNIGSITRSGVTFKVGGIAAKNSKSSGIAQCFAEVTLPDSIQGVEFGQILADGSSATDSYYSENGKLYTYNGKVYDKDVYTLAAYLSTELQDRNTVSTVAKEDYVKLFATENESLCLSEDGKTAWITVTADSNFYKSGLEDKEIEKVTFTPSDILAKVTYKDAEKTQVDNIITRVGYTDENGNYVRNSIKVNITCKNKLYTVKSVINKLSYSYMTKCEDVFSEEAANYSTNNFFTAKNVSGSSVADVQLYPCNSVLSISSVSVNDQVSQYQFDGNGTAESPFEINDQFELDVLRFFIENLSTYEDVDGKTQRYSKASYILKNDIKLSDDFTPIGVYTSSYQYGFEGTFDGNFCTITNYKYNDSNDYQGFFGLIRGSKSQPAVIKNLRILNAELKSSEGLGGQRGILAGTAIYAEITGCIVSGTVEGRTQLGGLLGYASMSKIANCAADVKIVTNYNHAWAGGLIGYAQESQVYNCYSVSSVNAEKVIKEEYLNLGGIAGYVSKSEFYSCYYDCQVSVHSQSSLKPLFAYKGIESKSREEMTGNSDFLHTLIIKSDEYGLETQWEEDKNNIFNSLPVTTSRDNAVYYVKNIASSAGNVLADKATYKEGETVTVTLYGDITSIEITDSRKNKLDDIAVEYSGNKATFKMPAKSIRIIPYCDDINFVGLGTVEEPFMIYTYEQLVLFSELMDNVNTYYKIYEIKDGSVKVTSHLYNDASYALGADIDGSKTSVAEGGYSHFWTINVLYGTFEGNGYTISNLKINYDKSKFNCPAIFYSFEAADIQNVTFDNILIKGNGLDYAYGSGILAYISRGQTIIKNVSFTNITVSDCNKLSFLIGNSGMFGNTISVENCYFENIDTTNCTNVYRYLHSQTNNQSNSLMVDNCLFVDQYGTKIPEAPQFESEDELIITNTQYLTDLSQVTDKIIADYSYGSESIEEAGTWGRDAEGKPCIALNDTKSISHIFIESELTNPAYIKLIDPDSVIDNVTEGEEVTVRFYRNTSLADFKVLSRGEVIPYIISDPEKNKDGWGTITFVMPDGAVTLSNSGAEPVLIIPGLGTEEDPYLISSAEEMKMIDKVTHNEVLQYKWDDDRYVSYINAYFKLISDIDMDGFEWCGIGTNSNHFFGTFDGDFHTIRNINKNYTSRKAVCGLFHTLGEGSVLRNLYIDSGCTFFSAYYWSDEQSYDLGIVAKHNYGTISKCLVTNSGVYSDYSGNFEDRNIGGIVGLNGESGVIEDTGIVNSVIDDWHANGDTFLRYRGAFTNTNDGIIRNCFVYNVKMTTGGFKGSSISYYGKGTIENCYAYLNSESNYYPYIYDVSKETFTSGQVAYLLNKEVTDSTQVWYQNLDNGYTPSEYPDFINNGINTVYNVNREDRAYSNIVLNDEEIYEISNPLELMAFSAYVNGGHFDADAIVVADIDMTGYNDYVPIGYTGLYHNADPAEDGNWGYKGNFDGQGYVISNLSVTGSDTSDLSYGLFGTVSGNVKNVAVENFKFTGAGKDSRVGAVAGQLLFGGKLTDCYAKNVEINTQINTTNGVAGGVAGASYSGEINNCYSYNVNIKAGRAGGIVADNYGDANSSDGSDRPGKAVNCYTNYGNICGRGTSTGGYCNIPDKIFKSGEITYLLENGREDSLWSQGEDKLPAFKGDKIYKNLCEGDVFYSTVDKDYEYHSIDDGCVRCNNCHNFDAATLVTEDNFERFGLTKDYLGLYAVENASNMYWFSERDAFENLEGGIVMYTDIAINSSVEPWVPINADRNFTFDGRGNTLTLNIDFSSEQTSGHLGLFSVCNYATVRDVILDGSVTGNTTAHIGGFSGTMYRTTVSKVLSYVDVTNTCTTSGSAGGIAGYFGGQHDSSAGLYSLIQNCAVYADIQGYNAGGIVGYGWNGKQYYDIKNAAYVGNVTGINAEGAIIGYHGNNQSARLCTFKNIHYLEADGLTFKGKGNANYTLDSSVGIRTEEQFTSGEITYLLNGGKSDGTEIWHQNIDTEPTNKYPVFDAETVYKNTMCDGELIEYSNTKDDVVHEYNNYHVCKRCIGLRPGEIAGIWGFSIGLGGNIGVNYYMVLDDCVLADPDAKMVFTVNRTGNFYTIEIPVSEAQKVDQFYVFTCEVAAKEMTTQIDCQIVISDDVSDTFHYTVKEYADYILENPETYAKEIPLVKAMLNYGAYAQIHFGYDTDNLANTSEYITEEEKVLQDVDLSEYEFTYKGEQEGVSYYATSLLLKSETGLKHYYIFDDPKDIESLNITAKGEAVTPVKDGKYHYIRFTDIPAHKLHCLYDVTIGDFTMSYGVFSYGYIAMNTSDDETLKDVIKALYSYNQEAIKYKASN